MISSTEKGTDLLLDESTLQSLKGSIRGKLITASDQSYDDERLVYNGMINKFPALIVKCVNVADVISAVNFARTHKLSLAVRAGGHNAGGARRL